MPLRLGNESSSIYAGILAFNWIYFYVIFMIVIKNIALLLL